MFSGDVANDPSWYAYSNFTIRRLAAPISTSPMILALSGVKALGAIPGAFAFEFVDSRGGKALVGGYNEALTFGQDYDLTERITARGVPLQILRETLYVLSLRRIRKVGRLRRARQRQRRR